MISPDYTGSIPIPRTAEPAGDRRLGLRLQLMSDIKKVIFV